MQILTKVNIDWLGKTKYFVAGSLAVLLVGGIAMYRDGGPLFSVDFKGGTVINVRFAENPPVDQIRKALAEQGLGDSTIQRIRDFTNPNTNEVVIVIPEQGVGDEAIDAGKNIVLGALRKNFGAAEADKQDFNSATAATLTEFLTRRDPLALGVSAGEQYKALGQALVSFRDTNRRGLVTNWDELRQVGGVNDAVLSAVKNNYYLSTFTLRSVESVGPRVGAQLRKQALLATLYALAGMLVYIAFRFEWVYGAAAVVAVIHDVLVTLGFFALFDYEISLTVLAALLTLVGYSMNDTIVIFDRMRENLRLMRREPLAVVANLSINQTLARTLITSGLTFITVLVLFLFGGEVLRSFAFALVVGIVVGSYSTIGIAAAMVVAWDKWRGGRSGAAPRTSPAGNNPRPSGLSAAAAGRR